MIRIGVISDTHDNLRFQDISLFLKEVDEIWHLGDVCKASVLDNLYTLGHPLFVVQGNNDFDESWPLSLRLEREGKVFYLIHIFPRTLPQGIDALLFGHTHVPCDETKAGVRLLNPGTVSTPNKGAPPSLGLLTVTSETIDWKILPL